MRSRPLTRVGMLPAATAAALAAALVVVPTTSAQATTTDSTAASSAVTRPAAAGASVVTMLTGDRVILRHDGAGHTTATLTPSSPHYGRPVQFMNTPAHTWVVPKLKASVRERLDPSVYDVAALAGKGRVPLKVTFARGATPRSLPGIQVRAGSARGISGGRTTASASYDAHRPLPASFASSLHGVKRITLASATPLADPSYDLHTLTINATTPKGEPLPDGETFVMNLDDARLFGTFGIVIDGQWKVSVPTGHYLLITDDFSRVVLTQVDVTDDTTATAALADATVKPHSAYPGHKSLGGELDLIGTDATGNGGFSFGYGGVFPKVSPLAQLDVGSLYSEVSNQWSKKGYEPQVFKPHQVITHPITFVASAKEVRAGVPTKLSFSYRPSDFAKVEIRHHGTGAKTKSYDGWAAFSTVDQGLFISGYPTVRPGVIHAQFLADKDLNWLSFSEASTSFRTLAELDDFSSYQHPSHGKKIDFFRAPITPVADRGSESGRTGFVCSLCVHGGRLQGNLAMIASAGTRQTGYSTEGAWRLRHGPTTIASGGGSISPFVDVPAGKRMTLEASTGPAAKGWRLSTHVSDQWRFDVPSSNAVVPLLRAAYVPPTGMDSVGKAGRVSFPITFDNLGPVDAKVTHASVRWSVDGTHWHRAALTRQDKNTFRVSYRNPAATKAHPTLSLNVMAKDNGGRSIHELVQDAYLLPHGTARRTPAHPAAHKTSHPAAFRPGKLCRTSGEHGYSCFVKLSSATRDADKASPDPAGWGAPALRDAYNIEGPPSVTPSTIAVIVAYDYPHAEADMNHYRAQFGLPPCTSADGCFTKLNQKGETGNYPVQDDGWGVEASLDLQMISASCPTCHIVLVEANQPTDKALFKAEQAAVNAGATVTNHSFGRQELTGAENDALAFDHPGVTAVASTGDYGYGPAQFPASAPNVVAVGGTVLSRQFDLIRGWTEKAWKYAGSGCSAYFDKPEGQPDTACHGRTDADVSAVAKGLAIYNTSLPKRYKGWLKVDGTSASSPFIAGMIASDGFGDSLQPADIYAQPSSFDDVVGGANGFCDDSYICTGVEGYDGPTGLGSPDGPGAFTLN